ncbi:tRNA lysidine(34) synthetase TilS [Flagellimonas onchidii]|uniref:tRNA lysidine(34) synthetase TilS n=1 Tax=Flagellimonas onchidii TaxID=2562684 RepID=UPI0010A68F96|nr:tRNA lysidine(34) synthetase TilS [Allomuricauda onchidii]
MLAQFKRHLDSDFALLKGRKLLLACSGGLDSVVLAQLCIKSGLQITLAHCNFKLRGVESDGDEFFVKQLAKNLGCPITTTSFNVKEHIHENGGSVQMAARTLRYVWFQELMDKEGFDYVLTAHHADDSLETFLINLSRGTGLEGLSGIPKQNNKIVRPLIGFSRNQILEYAKSEGISWREDASNKENKYLRNKIRHDIVPKLKELHPTFLDNVKRTQSHLNHSNALIENHIQSIKDTLFKDTGDSVKVKVEALLEYQPIEAYLYELFKDFGFTEWSNVKKLLSAMSGKEVLSNTHRLLKDREHLILSQKEPADGQILFIDEDVDEVNNPITLKIESVESVETSHRNVIFLDKEKLNYPLILRNWQKGDYFYPFGMRGRKKISKYFKDEKIDVHSKEKQWLLCSGHDIVWVVGMRLDERFKVDGTTKNILKVTLSV